MKKTRNLFVVTGSPTGIQTVLDNLQFKGLVVLPPGKALTLADITSAFEQNRSIACSVSSFESVIPEDAFIITTIDYETEAKSLARFGILCTARSDIAQQFEKIVEVNHLDIGDHKSNISSNDNDGPTPIDCAYCKYLNGVTSQNERTLYASKNFFVMPTVGQFRTGYLLIIPKEHIMSNAELDTDTMNEFLDVLHDVEYILRLTYHSNVLIWENGSGHAGTSKAKDSIVHSHVHIVPSNITSDDIERVSLFPFENVTMQTLYQHKEHSYLLVRSPNESIWRIVDSSKLYVPRQYVRQLVAEENGFLEGEFWNWRIYPFREKMRETFSKIIDTLTVNWNFLPDRIKQNTKQFVK